MCKKCTHSQMAGLATVIATAAGASPAQAKSRAISLNMAEALAVIALLGLSGTGKRATVRLVTGLLALMMISISE